MIRETLRTEYARQRSALAHGADSLPTFPGSALNAWRVAKEAPRLAARMAALDIPRYTDSNGKAETELPNGAKLVYRVEYDDCETFTERSMLSVEWLRRGRPRSEMPEGWINRDGAVLWCGDRDYALVTADYPLADRVKDKRRRMSRHAAWLDARRELSESFDFWRDYFQGRESWVYCSVTLYAADGSEIAQDGCGGIESGGDYWREYLAETATYMLRQYADDCARDIEMQRGRVATTRATVRKLAQELRRASRCGSDFPTACAVLRANIAALRARVRESVAQIRASRAAVFAIWKMGIESNGQ